MRRTWRELVTRVLPWAALLAVVFFLVRRYSIDDIVNEMSRGHAAALIAPAVVVVLVSLLCVGFGDWFVMRRTVQRPLSPWVQLRGRAGISVLMTLGYLFSGGGLGVWIARKTGTKTVAALGLLLYIMVSDVTAVAIIATVALGVGGGELLDPALHEFVRWFAPVLVLSVIAAALLAPKFLAKRFSDPQHLLMAARLPFGDFVGNLMCRVLHIGNVILCTLWAARGFGLDISPAEMWTYMPVIILVSALPINVFGLGVVQVVWLVFEKPGTSGESILAFHFLWNLLVLLAIVGRGLPFFRTVMAEIAGKGVKASASGDSAPPSSD